MNDDSKDRFRSDQPRKKHHHRSSNNSGRGPNQGGGPQQRGPDGRQDLRWGRSGQSQQGGGRGPQSPQGPHRGGQGGQGGQGGHGRFRRGPNNGQQPYAKFGGREPQKPGPNSGPVQGHDRHRQQQRRPESIRDAAGRIDPFELFCAYHLGITIDGGYRLQNIHDLARRFGVPPAELKQALTDYQMDPQTMINSDFDLTLAQLDMQVAPEGVDRRELAKVWFEEFQNARPNSRDWQKEIADDAKENEKIFGK